MSFKDTCGDAISNNKIIEIDYGVVITIDYSIIIKNNRDRLIIRGKSNNNDNDDNEIKRPTIIGSGHSVFQIGGRKTSLILENLIINHECNRYLILLSLLSLSSLSSLSSLLSLLSLSSLSSLSSLLEITKQI